jgi:hypothetical protein
MKVLSLAFFLFAKCTYTVESCPGDGAEEESYKNSMRMQQDEAVGTNTSTNTSMLTNRRVIVGAGGIHNILY